jgi:hypothetical protein
MLFYTQSLIQSLGLVEITEHHNNIGKSVDIVCYTSE